MYDLSIKIKNYKSFADKEEGFEKICRANLIIGKNNTGKSALMDVIEVIANNNYQFNSLNYRAGANPEIIFENKISQQVIDSTFRSNLSGGSIKYGNHHQYGLAYLNRKIKWSKNGSGPKNVSLISCDDQGINPSLKDSGEYSGLLPANIPIPLEGKLVKRLAADRDIKKEVSGIPSISPNGDGITNAIRHYILDSTSTESLVSEEMLNALNKIFSPETTFLSIKVKHNNSSNLFEIYLTDRKNKQIPLSECGSGLKTIISVLSMLILFPDLARRPLEGFIFVFEEIENNLHPSILRSLNNYIYDLAKEKNFIYFLTTHSNVLIDSYSKQDDAQIVHVTQQDTISSCRTVITYIHAGGILDDLDVRASDLLQANGIIWVEGPSDRIYLNHWINLWSNGELKEGNHYQIIFYGGRLLAHLDAREPNAEEKISILNANRNAIVIIDSDKRKYSDSINQTKQRIKEEIEAVNGFCWITEGREIENYIPQNLIADLFSSKETGMTEKYDSVFDIMNRFQAGLGDKYKNGKPLLAEKLLPLMTRNNLEKSLDLAQQMKLVCERIRNWNQL